MVREALKYYFKGDNFLDLINEGNKGLIEALKKFDLTRENRFFTYALWWVRSEIRRYLSKNQNLISLPDIFYNDYLNFKKAYFKLSKKLKRHPSEKELAEVPEDPGKEGQGDAGRPRRDHLPGQGDQRRQLVEPDHLPARRLGRSTPRTS